MENIEPTIFFFFLDGPGSTVQMHSSPRSPLSGIPVRTAPAAAVSPIQVLQIPQYMRTAE